MIELESALGGANRDLAITMGGAEAKDVLHSNSVQVLDGAHEDVNPAFESGNVLVCLRELNAFVVIDPRARRRSFGSFRAGGSTRTTRASRTKGR